MNGQWIGPYTGTNTGLLVADIDDAGDRFDCLLYALDQNPQLPPIASEFSAPKGSKQFDLRIGISAIGRGPGLALTAAELRTRFPEATVPSYVNSHWNVSDSEISIAWQTEIGTNGQAKLTKSVGGVNSELKADVKTWGEFKESAATLAPYQYLFRGQGNSTWKLRTSFHRTGRSNLMKFMRQDVNTLHRHLSGLLAHRLNLADSFDYAAFLALSSASRLSHTIAGLDSVAVRGCLFRL